MAAFDAHRVQIGLLEGKSNWVTWKYKIMILLRGISGAIDLLEGKLVKPKPLAQNESTDDKKKYTDSLLEYTKADTNTLLILTTNITEETLTKVMRFSTAYEVWLELHRLFDGNVEDKTYDLCSQFFTYKRDSGDDIATHMSKLKNIWNQLQMEISKEKLAVSNLCNCDLPELLLICKILNTLPEEYFSFKSSWMLMPKAERSVDNLTNQLCAYEKALINKNEEIPEALATEKFHKKISNNKN